MISTSEIYQHIDSRPNTCITDSSRLGGSVRTLLTSPKMIRNSIKAPAREPPPLPPDEYYEDMEEGGKEEEEDEEDEEDEEEVEEEDKVIEINEAKEVILYRVQQGSGAIRVKEMLRPDLTRAPVVPPPRSDSFNIIHNLSNSQRSQLLDHDSIFESGFENPLHINGLAAVLFEAGNDSGTGQSSVERENLLHSPAICQMAGQSSVEKDRWPNERGGSGRKPVLNSADGPSSYSLHRAASVQITADSHGKSPSCSPVAHSKQYHSHYKTTGYSRLRAAKLYTQDFKVVPDAVNNLPEEDFVPRFSRTQYETITSSRRIPIPETDEADHIEPPASPNDGLGRWRNPVIHREDGLRSHPTSPLFATPAGQRAPAVPFWVKLGHPLP